MIPKGRGRPRTRVRTQWRYASGQVITTEIRLGADYGSLTIWFGGRQQTFDLAARRPHFGGHQWYVICPSTGKHVRVLYLPYGTSAFASRHHWGRRAAY